MKEILEKIKGFLKRKTAWKANKPGQPASKSDPEPQKEPIPETAEKKA